MPNPVYIMYNKIKGTIGKRDNKENENDGFLVQQRLILILTIYL